MYKLAKMTAHRQLACPEKRVPVPSLSPQTARLAVVPDETGHL
jgi:hypothetical protein